MKRIIIVGFGNQGVAWAKNLRDSGVEVLVSGRAHEEGGRGIQLATSLGFETLLPDELVKIKAPVALLIPDDAIGHFARRYLAPQNRGSKLFIFAHGYAMSFNKMPLRQDDKVLLLAPKGLGAKLRENFIEKKGFLAATSAKSSDGHLWNFANELAEGLGIDKLVSVTYKQETFTDLLSEQGVLCGTVPFFVEKAVEFLVGKGIPRELAYYECVNELKLVVDLMVERGIDGMRKAISPTARIGGAMAEEMLAAKLQPQDFYETLWENISSGAFMREFEMRRKREINDEIENLSLEDSKSKNSSKANDRNFKRVRNSVGLKIQREIKGEL